MKFVKKLAVSLNFLFTLVFSVNAFSNADILSPLPGTWNNVQALVLDNCGDLEVYYSLTGADPLVSGFSYDGPVIIDETGDITLNLTVLEKNGRRSDYTVEYKVIPFSSANIKDEDVLFINNLILNPVQRYVSGTEIVLPEGYLYSMDLSSDPYIREKSISVNKRNLYRSYIPVTVGNEFYKFHFILNVCDNPELEIAAVIKNVELPFEVKDWTNLSFKDSNFIYQIDDGFWQGTEDFMEIDRSVSHIISWQSVAYEEGNPVSSFVLPAKPVIEKKVEKNGEVVFSIPENYHFQLSLKGLPNLYNSVLIDSFKGYDLEKELTFEVYYDGIKAGELKENVSIDKMPPKPPLITSSTETTFTRRAVEVVIQNQNNTRIFYTISQPVEFENVQMIGDYDFDSKCFFPEYKMYEGENILLKSSGEKVTYFKIKAYAQDYSGNVSSVSEYEAVVDEFNYYLDMSAGDKKGDGTYVHPFSSLEDAVNVINANSFTKLHVIGNLVLDSQKISIKSNCLITGVNSQITFKEGSVVSVENADVEFNNFIIEKNTSLSGDQNMFYVTEGGVKFDSCEIIGVFAGNGILVDSKSAKISIINSGLTVQASSYSCGISGINSDADFYKGRFTSVAQTCVNLSLHGGNAKLSNSLFSVIASSGRCIEFTEVNASLLENRFTGNISGNVKNVKPVWNDVNTVYSLFSGNTQEGF